MNNAQVNLASLNSSELLARTHLLVKRSCGLEADLLSHLGEIDERKLYLERAHPSMFAFCVAEFGFSEEATYNRIMVARAARRLPAMIDVLRSGDVHLGGLRLLAPHLTSENHHAVLARAAGKTKRQIEELVAQLAPKPPVPSAIRKLPEALAAPSVQPVMLALESCPQDVPKREQFSRPVAPLSESTYKVQFTASRALRDKLVQAQDLLRHRFPDGDLASIVDSAMDLLIDRVKKERFAVGRKPRAVSTDGGRGPETDEEAVSRYVPSDVRRAVFERDGGQCTFTDERGRRCPAKGHLEFDHRDGFARTHLHDKQRMRLLCRAHNQHAAERMYGRAFMQRARRRTRPGTSTQPTLL